MTAVLKFASENPLVAFVGAAAVVIPLLMVWNHWLDGERRARRKKT